MSPLLLYAILGSSRVLAVGPVRKFAGFFVSDTSSDQPPSRRQLVWISLKLAESLDYPYTFRTMKPSVALNAHRAEIREIILAHRASNARVFGSVVHGTDTDLSDLDILIDPTSETTLFDLGAIRYKLRTLLGVPVDILTPNSLPDSFRDSVIKEAKPI